MAITLQATIEQLRDLPPSLVITAEADVLRDEGEAYTANLRSAGAPITTTRYSGIIYDFVTVNSLRETHAAQADINQASQMLKDALHRA